jgi:regulator of sigma E protease
MTILWTIFLVALFFGGTIFVHEYGHYLAARKRGLKIEAFSIGFGPRLFGWTNKDGVEFKVSLLPLGGYVRLPQLSDMAGIEGEITSETTQLPPLSWADKVIVSVMGAVFNILLAIALSLLLWGIGQYKNEAELTTTIGTVLETLEVSDGESDEVRKIPSPAYAAGLQAGDKILFMDGKKVRDWEDVVYAIALGSGRDQHKNASLEMTVERNDRILDFTVLPTLENMERLRVIGIEPQFSLQISEVMKDSPAEKAGLLPGDQVVGIDNLVIRSGINDLIRSLKEKADRPVNLEIIRNNELLSIEVLPQRDEDGEVRIGIRASIPQVHVHVDPATQLRKGFQRVTQTLGSLLNPSSDVGLRHLSGPVGISYVFYRFQNEFTRILGFAILLNISLAVFNLLPIPVLDGGHIMFATIQALRGGKPLPPRLISSIQSVFVLLILFLFVYVFFYDTRRVIQMERMERNYQQQQGSSPSVND